MTTKYIIEPKEEYNNEEMQEFSVKVQLKNSSNNLIHLQVKSNNGNWYNIFSLTPDGTGFLWGFLPKIEGLQLDTKNYNCLMVEKNKV